MKEILTNPQIDDISERQLREDLKVIEEKYGAKYDLSLSRGRERIYKYRDTSFSIFPQLSTDKEILREAIEFLSVDRGDLRYDMLRFYLIGLIKGISSGGPQAMSFDFNSDDAGMKHAETVLDAIINRHPLKMEYQTFDGTPYEKNIHPYHLRQYNRRWYVFALDEESRRVENYPLDRIVSLQHLSKLYIPTDINFDEYFDDIVGVSNYAESQVETIVLKVSRKSIDYIRTKPLHRTQTEIKNMETDDHVFLRLNVKVNTELKMLLFSYGDAIEVLEPAWMRGSFVNNMRRNYGMK